MARRSVPPSADPRSKLGAPGAHQLWRLIRFRHFWYFLVLPLASVELARPTLGSVGGLLRGVAIAFSLLSFGYLANAVGDRDMDADREKNPLVGMGSVDERQFVLPIAAFAALSLALSVMGPWPVVAATSVCLLSGYVYSLGPRLKRVPLVGTLLNASNFAPLLYLGLAQASLPPRVSVLVAAFVALLLENQLLHEAADAAEDRAGGLRTTFLALGPYGTAALAALAGGVLWAVTVQVARARGLPLALTLHAAPHFLLFPALLVVAGRSGERMAQARKAQRWAAAISGALLVAVTW